MTLSNTANTYSGALAVNQGTVNLSSSASTMRADVSSGASLDLSAGAASKTVASLSGAGSVSLGNTSLTVNQSANTTVSGSLSGGERSSLTKSGSGNLTLSNTNSSFLGSASVNGGTVTLGAAGGLGVGAATVNSGSILDANSFNLSNATLTLAGGTFKNSVQNSAISSNGNLVVSDVSTIEGAGTIVIGGVVSGNKNLQKNGGSLVFYNNNNTYTGTVIVNEGTLNLKSTASTGMGVTLVNGSWVTTDLSNTSTFSSLGGNGNVQLGNSAIVLNFNGDNSLIGNITGSSTASLEKKGTGSFTLTGSGDELSSNILVSAGSLVYGSSGAFGSGSTTISTNGSVDLKGFSATNSSFVLNGGSLLNSAAQSSSINGGLVVNAQSTFTTAGNTTVDGLFTGSGSLAKSGAGVLNLTNTNNTYSGALAINQGTVNLSSCGQTMSTSIALGASLNLGYGNSNKTLSALSGAGSLSLGSNHLTLNQTSNTELSGVMSGTGDFTKSGIGVLTLSNLDNTYSGLLSVAQGSVSLFSAGNAMKAAVTSGATLNLSAGNDLKTIAALTGAGVVNLGSKSVEVNHTGTNVFSGQINGTGTLIKSGSGIFTLDTSSTMNGSLRVQGGLLEVKGQRALSQIQVDQDATVQIDGFGIDHRTAMTANISGAGLLKMRHGWHDLRMSNLNLNRFEVCAAEGAYDIARVMVDESFAPSGQITINGILETHISQDTYDLTNTIDGSGLLKKYGSGVLNLSGDVTQFTGGIQVFEGVVTSAHTLSGQLEVYSGSTLLSNIHNMIGSTATLSGNLMGAQFTNDGVVHIGNNSTGTQILDYQSFINRGTVYVNENSYGHVRVNAFENSESLVNNMSSWGSFYVPNGTLALNGKFTNTNQNIDHNYAIAYRTGEIHLDPGSAYEGVLYSYFGGKIRIQGANIDQGVHVSKIYASYGGVLDIGVDKINDVTNTMTVSVDNLFMYGMGTLVLRPDISSTSADLPLLQVNQRIRLPQATPSFLHYSYMNLSNESAIRILPQGSHSVSDVTTVNLLKLNGEANTAENRDRILELLQPGLLYELQNAAFSNDGLLTCSLRYKNFEEVIASSEFSNKIPGVYKTLAQTMLGQQRNSNNFSHFLYQQVADSLSASEILEHLRSFAPVGAIPSAAYGAISTHHNSSMMQAQRQNAALNALLGQNISLGKSSSEHHLLKKVSAHNAQIYQKNAQMNPGANLESYRYLNIDGLSIDSQLQYEHQWQPNRSDDEIGYSSSSWTSTLGASYSMKEKYSVGVLASTRKTKEALNPNTIMKTGTKDDRLNTVAVMGYGQLDNVPLTLSGQLSYGQHNYVQYREWSQNTESSNDLVALQAVADYKAYETNLQAELGYTYVYSDIFSLQPFVGGTWSSTTNMAYQERATVISTGSDSPYGYYVPQQDYSAQLYSLGLEFIGQSRIEGVQSVLFARIGASTQKKSGDSTDFVYSYQSDLDTQYTMSYQNYRYNTLDIMLGAQTTLHEGVTLSVVYLGNYGEYLKNHSASLSLDYSF